MEKRVGQVAAGSTPIYEVVDLNDGFYIEIREIDNLRNRMKFPKQAAHVLAQVLMKVDVK